MEFSEWLNNLSFLEDGGFNAQNFGFKENEQGENSFGDIRPGTMLILFNFSVNPTSEKRFFF